MTPSQGPWSKVPYAVKRLADEPIVSANLFAGPGGENINGPSLIAVPPWLPRPLGKFYLYFAHHHGTSIRLACADRLEGPWRLVGPSLKLSDVPACRHHIASPDVHVDNVRREIRMYFHGVVRAGIQLTFVATSPDGIAFTSGHTPVADFYLRVVPWRGRLIGMAKAGQMYVSEPGRQQLEALPWRVFHAPEDSGGSRVRHVALRLREDMLDVFFTRVGDAPESIFLATIDLSRPMWEWQTCERGLILQPELRWEGAGLPVFPSRAGWARDPEHALRDPAIFEWEDRCFLLYSGAGEQAIGIAELMETSDRS
ncbi:MAG: hypothetical protein U1F47_00625 [Hyphomicrobiales bacterium]